MRNRKLHTLRRTYFFNYFHNEERSNIIEIIESKILSSGKYKRDKIQIFEEDMEDFCSEIKKILENEHK